MILLVLLISAASLTSSQGFECNSYALADYEVYCVVKETAVIDAPDVRLRIPRNRSITNIVLNENKNVEYLPGRLYLTFPNLRKYFATNCAIVEITETNFVNLRQLHQIELQSNLIETISSEAFDGLIKLEYIFLSKLREVSHP